MSKDKVPTGKIARASRFLRTGAKVGRNYAKHYSKKLVGQEVEQNDLDKANAEDIFDGFSQLRGSALKVAQMLSMDSINFSESFTNVMQKAQYSVPPMSAPLAVQAFKKSIGKNPSEVFDKFNSEALKAASMGQVHEAWKDGEKLAIKIQYPGVGDSIRSDMKMVKKAASRVMHVPVAEIAPYFQEIEDRLMEEADYEHELKASMEFAEAAKDIQGIVFPKYYPEYSSDRVLTMQWIEGKHLKDYMATDPSLEERTKMAYRIWDFYEYQIHVLRKVNADPHPGNFLFRDDDTVGVLDFGCTKELTDELYRDYFKLAEPGLFQDKERAEQALIDNNIIREDDPRERRDYLIDLFGRLITLITQPYHDGEFDFSDDSYYHKVTEISKEISKLGEMRGNKDFLFLNKTYYGLYSLFSTLGVKLTTASVYRDFLRPEKKGKVEIRPKPVDVEVEIPE